MLSLGHQALTGLFPALPSTDVQAAPLSLVWCEDCNLIQLGHSFDSAEMYGDNYGYRSGLNPTMVSHLEKKVKWLASNFGLEAGDSVLDIGSNDGTLLNSYPDLGITRVGFDPVASKYLAMYDPGIRVVEDFFSLQSFESLGVQRSKIITSIAMFYDLEDPSDFVRQISEVLDSDGVWHFEQSYLPSMLRTNAYDTICHEHYEYYSLGVVEKLLRENGLKVLDVQLNSVNGGSFAVTAAKVQSRHTPNTAVIEWLLNQEANMSLDRLETYLQFGERVERHRGALRSLISSLRKDGKSIAAYGASTKGNVLLQYCGFGKNEIDCVAEVNQEKFGKYTPGTGIPILPEQEVRDLRPDYLLVLPWHFRDFIFEKESAYLEAGGRLIFPLPEIEIVS